MGPTRSIRAAVLRSPGQPFDIVDCRLDAPRAGEVRLRLRASGVCHSDFNFIKGDKAYPLPAVFGHEAAGVVVDVGDGVRRVKPGDHVVISMTPSCGYCDNCLRGNGALCSTTPHRMEGAMPDGTRRLHADGSALNHFVWLSTFAEEAVVPESTCVVIRDDAPLEKMCLIGCGVTTGVMAALTTAGIRTGDRVAVFGCGGVGLAVVMGAALTAAREIVAIDPSADKVAVARELGATRGIVGTAQDAIDELAGPGRRGVDVSFEATGSLPVMELALAACADGGTAVIVGVATRPDAEIRVPYSWLRRNRRVLGTHMGHAQIRRDIPALVDMYMAGRLPIDAIVSSTLGLSGINDAIAAMEGGEATRTVIDFDLERSGSSNP